MKASVVRDELKHVRLIHFTLTTLSGVMLYLIIVAWSVPPQLYAELGSLEDFLRRLHAEGVPLTEIDGQAETRAEDQILESLRNLIDVRLQWDQIGHGMGWDISPMKCVQVATSADEQKLPLVDRLNYVTSEPCRCMLPERMEGNVTDVKAWINKAFVAAEGRAGFKGFKELKDIVFARVDRFTLAPDSRVGPGNPGRVTIALTTEHIVSNKMDTTRTGEIKEVTVNVTLRAESRVFPKD